MIRSLALVLGLAAVGALGTSCVRVPPERADAMSAVPKDKLGEDRLSLKWKFMTADRRGEINPQEFAAAAVNADTFYVGSASGTFFALRASDGRVRWRKQIGAVGCAPLVVDGTLYIGTMDGTMIALDAQTAQQRWKYQSRGPIEQTPTTTSNLIVFANEADQVVALDAATGKFKWQYKGETPEQYTLRGHAGVTVDSDLMYTGFSNGTIVALRKDTGSVAWSTSLKGDFDKFMDVDATPLVIGDKVYATSSSGGVYAVDKATGQIRWRMPFYDAAQPSEFGNVGGITTDGKMLYVSVAELGTYAVDFNGNVVWRVGAKGGGEPAAPVVHSDMVVYSLAQDGLFIANRRTGETLEFFDPGDGVSAQPTITSDGRLYVMSNHGILYAFDLD